LLYQIADKIIALFFDTTALKTVVWLQEHASQLSSPFEDLFFGRHHIHKVVLKDTYKLLFGPPPGPEVPLFKQFRGRWDFLDKTSFDTLSDEEPLDEMSESQRLKMIVLVALIQRFQAHTKDEQQKQFLIKVVHHDCKTVKITKVGVAAKFSPAP